MRKLTQISLSVSMIVLIGGCAGSTALNVGGDNAIDSEKSAVLVSDRPFIYDDYETLLQT